MLHGEEDYGIKKCGEKMRRWLFLFIKRTFDIVLSSILLLLLLPFFPILAFIIKYQSPGPLFFLQERTGLNGRTFMMYKFRSMHINDESHSLQATHNDPRKYPFGHFMRRMSIDELPQLFNILKGDMSLIGPRPHMLAHTVEYTHQIPYYMERHAVKPGLTGWAQVKGWRGPTPELWQMEGRVMCDLWYVDHQSLWVDIKILFLTVKIVLFPDEGAT